MLHSPGFAPWLLFKEDKDFLAVLAAAVWKRWMPAFGLRGDIPITSDTLPTVWIMKDGQLKRALEVVADYERDKTKSGK